VLQAFAPGIHPRSEELVQATRDLDRGRTTPEAVDEQVQRDLDELVRVQQEAGLDLVAGGMLRWQDLFRPLVEAADGLELGALTRFLDTNTFYRAPSATDAQPRLRAPLEDRYIASLEGPRLVTLPSPFALAHGTGIPPKVIAESVLKPQIEAVEAELIVLSEPFLAREEEPPVGELEEALGVLDGARIALQLTFGNAIKVLDRAGDLPVAGLGIDFYATPIDAVPEGLDKLLLAGVVDARSSAVEEPREVAEFADRLRAERGVEQIALTPNGDLQFVSQQIAHEKLRRLGAAKTASVEAAA
jgi:5-methyltetrahydropteroyltriglutamate--homocysteine methyltransferase